MLQHEISQHFPARHVENAPLPLRHRDRHGESLLSPAGKKRCRPETDDDCSTTDFEGVSDREDFLETSQDSDSSDGAILPNHSENMRRFALQCANRISPQLLRWMGSARYIKPPEHRIPPRKRTKRSIFMETEDPNEPSTILILLINGYFRLSCPFFIADPARHESCTLQHDLRSIGQLIKHLKMCHPSTIYCPICGQTFDAELARDRHIRRRSCICRNFCIPKGVSRSQLRKIIEEDDRNQREEERWRRIYAVVFPEAERPPRGAAYHTEGLPLAVSMARDYWVSHGRRLVEDFVTEEGLSGNLEFTEPGVSALCELTGKELIESVILEARSSQKAPAETAGGLDGTEWETVVKAEQE